MNHQYFIPNEELFGGLWPDDRDQWPEAYTWVFEGVPRGFCADVLTEEMGATTSVRFVWNGVVGTCYKVNAFLPSWDWNECAANKFADWRLAVFAPSNVDRRKPIVVAFTGAGGDISDLGWTLPHVINDLGCICVAFDTHMTGIRNLLGPYRKFEENVISFKEKAGRNVCTSAFTCMTKELSFNVRQIVEFVARMYKLPHRKFITAGFSLGAYFASQIALSQPNCLGMSGGCGLLHIMDYVRLPQFPSRRVVPLIPSLCKMLREVLRALNVRQLEYWVSVAQIDQVAYELVRARKGQRFYLNCAEGDTVMANLTDEVQDEYRRCISYYGGELICIKFPGGHSPFINGPDDVGKIPCVGTGMIASIRELLNDMQPGMGTAF